MENQEINFKIIAVRLVRDNNNKGCADHIKKCLKENVFYYLCNDYTISPDSRTISQRHSNMGVLCDDFFSFRKEDKPFISISAIVGRNSDGKSSLVELIIRLLNNCAQAKNIGNDINLMFVDGVYAELYYQINATFYQLLVLGSCIELRPYAYNKDSGIYMIGEPVNDDDFCRSFFYTMVSNYSHYAYNTEEIDREDSNVGSNEGHWLHYVFHKNDGYQAPLSLHPYRYRGNIDINREKELTKQRVLMTYAQEYLRADGDRDKVLKFGDKRAEELRLSDPGYSKLQEVTLKKVLMENKGVRLLQKEIEYLQTTDFDFSEKSDEDVMMFVHYAEALKRSYSKYVGHPQNKMLLDRAKIWLLENELNEERSDLTDFVMLMRNLADVAFVGTDLDDFISICDKWEEYMMFSLFQLQWLDLVDEICDDWNIYGLSIDNNETLKFELTPEVIFAPYTRLDDKQKCLHYFVYKTISIFENYGSYGYPCRKYKDEALFFGDNTPGLKSTIDSTINAKTVVPFARMSMDWNSNSHIVMKMKQVYNYYKDVDSTRSLYGSVNESKRCVFSRLTAAEKKKFTIRECLPPPIFNWDIYFKKDNGGDLVSMQSLSSGEKQKLNCISAVIYHLQNIGSVSGNLVHYNCVNLVFEEIELYFHPEWQRSYIFELISLIRNAHIAGIKSINMIFVTHSPYILSDIPKTNVLFLDNGMPACTMQENTFGANINGLLKNGFFLPSLPMGEFAHQKINDLFGKLHSGDFDVADLPQIKNDIMTVGEPAIRAQLLMLYNTYKRLDDSLEDEAFRKFVIQKLNHD